MTKILQICVAIVLLQLPLMGWAQAQLFKKYSDKKEVKSLYISKAMLSMSTTYYTEDLYIGSVAKHLNSVQLLQINAGKDNRTQMEMRADIRSLLKSSKYELLMKQKNRTSNTEFYIARKGDKIKELIMFKDGISLKFLYLEGEMTENDVRDILLHQGATSSLEFIHIPDMRNLAISKSLDALESLKSLESLESLEGLKHYRFMDDESWKELEEQLRRLEQRLKDKDFTLLTQKEISGIKP